MHVAVILVMLGSTLAASVAVCAPPKPMAFLRYVALPQAKAHLDTAIVRYTKGKVAVDLVGAVHIADKKYYDTLNRAFSSYDKVLFELVKPDELDVRDMGHSDGTVSGLQRFIKDWLALDFQLDCIRYDAKNFVHADMDSGKLGESLRAHAGDILGSLLAWSLGDAARLQHADGTLRLTTWELMRALSDPDRPRALKRLLGQELSEVDLAAGDVGGFGFGSVLIGQRNAIAAAVLAREMAGKSTRFAIFYGAAHLPDLEQRLIKLGFERGKIQWLVAWDLSQKP